MSKAELIAFREHDVKEIVEKLGYGINHQRFLVDKAGNTITCHVCESKLDEANLGNVVAGSDFFFCDNPLCFITYKETLKQQSY